MAWAKLDDQFAEHPRIEPLSDKAFRLHVAGICLSARKLTDGHIGGADARILEAITRARPKHVAELVEAGVWTANGSGWVIRDYLDYNPPAEVVKERRRRDLERKKAMENPRRRP